MKFQSHEFLPPLPITHSMFSDPPPTLTPCLRIRPKARPVISSSHPPYAPCSCAKGCSQVEAHVFAQELREGVWPTSLQAWGTAGLRACAQVSVDTRCVLCLQNKQQYLFSSGRSTLCVWVWMGTCMVRFRRQGWLGRLLCTWIICSLSIAG